MDAKRTARQSGLVNFWATWCPPCRKEIPDLEKLYSHFKDQGFVVLAISEEDESKVAPFIAQEKDLRIPSFSIRDIK